MRIRVVLKGIGTSSLNYENNCVVIFVCKFYSQTVKYAPLWVRILILGLLAFKNGDAERIYNFLNV